MMRVLPCLALMSALVAGGCTTVPQNPRYPSLRPREIESRSAAEPVSPTPVATPNPAIDAKIADLRKMLDANDTAFDKAAAEADRATTKAKGDPVGGERWIAAQTALAGLDILRQTTSSITAEIDDAAMTRASDGSPPYPALDALHDAADAVGLAQSKRIADLQARLPAA